jgi:thiol-disulfide isomerase/thioredoxin
MVLLVAAALVLTAAPDAETRVVQYLENHVRTGQPVVASDLYNDVFKTPEERAALNRLFNAFFKIPLFAAQYQKAKGHPPSVAEIAEQFRFEVPGEADLMLKIMEADPRMPKFLLRDPSTGAITRVDVDAILADRRFGRPLERTIAGWEGKPVPAFETTSWDGKRVSTATLEGRPYVVYFWFTGCPPCTKTGPMLMDLRRKYGPRGLEVVGANADDVLEMPYSDDDRRDYARKLGLSFTLATMTPAMQEAFGTVSVFPTLFFVDRKGIVVDQLVGLNEEATLDRAASLAVAGP